MAKESEEARDERKRRFIAEIKGVICRDLITPLAEKAKAYLEGEIPAEDVFRAAHYVARRGDEITGDFKKKPSVILAGIAMDENKYITEIGEIAVKVRLGGITNVFADAIVNPASPDGTMAAGLAGAVKEAGGGEIEKEAVSKAPIAAGTAVATGAGTLPFLHVIHAPTLDAPGGAATTDTVRAAISAALALADELELETVNIPGMGTGAGGIPPLEAAAAIVAAIEAHDPSSVSNINLVDLNEETVDAFVKKLEEYDEKNG